MNDSTFHGNGKVAYVPVVVNAKPPKPQTNADRIRGMSDEELAEFLAKSQKFGDIKLHYDGYYQLWLDWLKQEVGE